MHTLTQTHARTRTHTTNPYTQTRTRNVWHLLSSSTTAGDDVEKPTTLNLPLLKEKSRKEVSSKYTTMLHLKVAAPDACRASRCDEQRCSAEEQNACPPPHPRMPFQHVMPTIASSFFPFFFPRCLTVFAFLIVAGFSFPKGGKGWLEDAQI
jgi:hypothetical protein